MLIILSGCQKETTTSYIKKDTTMTGIQEISYEELQNTLQLDTAFVLYIGRPDCSDCREFHPILETYMEEHKGVYVYYLNIQAFRDASRREDANAEEIAFFENMQEELSFSWVPTLHVYKDQKIVDSYQYLDSDFYTIEDSNKQEKKKKEFITDFEHWMNKIYE